MRKRISPRAGASRRDFLKTSTVGLVAAAVAPRTLAGTTSIADAEARGAVDSDHPLVLRTQGSFMVGGTVITGPTGDTFHGDHAYVQYQIPPDVRQLPLVMWRRGRAGRSTVGATIPNAVPGESNTFNIFRLGLWLPPGPPQFFPNVQFPRTQEAGDQYWRQQTPNTGPEGIAAEIRDFQGGTVAALFGKIGPGILLTHSNSGQYGWVTAMKAPDLVRAIIAYEPAAFSYPQDEVPAPVPTQNAQIAAITAPQLVSAAGFQKLTRMPIQVIYGDNIEFTTPSSIFGVELWRVVTQRAQQFVDAVNRHGGDAQVLYLPTMGLHGNTHFAFSDLNNLQVADLLSEWLHEKGLDQRGKE